MTGWRGITLTAGAALAAALACEEAFGQKLGGGGDIELPLGRLVIGLALCALVAFVAVLLLKRYQANGRLPLSFAQRSAGAGSPARRIRVLETHRLSQHADLCRFVSSDTEYLVIVSQGGALVLKETPAPSETRAGP